LINKHVAIVDTMCSMWAVSSGQTTQ